MRLFVAFLLADDVRAHLKQTCETLARRCPGVRWTPPEQWHVTVQFLGEMADRDVPRIMEALRRGAARSEPFRMSVGGGGCFPPRGPVRIVWAGAVDESGIMGRTVAAIGSAMDEAGFPPEARPWHGHVTLGRVAEDRSGGTLRNAVGGCSISPVVQPVESVSLMSSVLSPGGARYTQVQRVLLGTEDV